VPVGPLRGIADGHGLIALEFDPTGDADALLAHLRHRWTEPGTRPAEPRVGPSPVLRQLQNELSEYFAVRRVRFDVPVHTVMGTAFERSAWAALCDIPFGQTRTYGQQAAMLGNPSATRAVGRANGANPVAIVVPCHRVIGAGGALTGFGGGLDRKAWLLRHEARHAPGGGRLFC
jgi:AraC family transcriptional regulator of adaptative response/methylated-DNA-[protein]-cysteine methyltransferase